jgi:hypothetical protein
VQAARDGLNRRTPVFSVWVVMGRQAALAMDLAIGLGSGVAVSAVCGPRDAAALEIHADTVAVAQEFLAIDDRSADRDFISQRSDLCHFARLPWAAGNYAGTMGTDVIRIGQFCSIDRLILRLAEMHNNGDWYALLDASVESA